MQKIVQDIADELVASGAERGLQVAVYRRGELLADVVAGVADAATGRPFTSSTPVYATSTGKGVTAAVVHVLAERKAFSYDTPIAELWPEFGARGKERATIRHALSHQAGVPGVPEATTPEDLCDWDLMCAAIADAEPWWEPGTRCGYHPQTFGYLLGEVVRRATGKRISQVLEEEVAGPLGVSGELFFAVPEAELGRLARIEEVAPPVTPPPSLRNGIPFFRVVGGYTAAPMAAMPDAGFSNRRDVLTAEIPAGGTMTARAVARVYDALLTGELVPPARLRELSAPAVRGLDEVTGVEAAWGLGYAIGLTPGLAAPTVFGMPGSGGTVAFADTRTGLAVGILKNRIGDFATVDRIGSAVLSAAP
ncbi:serine hydrolase domain-containing protein [Nonomuraea harbinensis]|uniref:Serine hydrolase domain-containing protein n=1 Tax=Nonomuraea harbinensis TaxID=1286938 RepID=A0ABW1BPD9_9ACTN|nr:serine hydrolase domain-containing protein [Nonomuraea harbinensis]